MEQLEALLASGMKKPEHWIDQYHCMLQIRLQIYRYETCKIKSDETELLVAMERIRLRLAEKTLRKIENL